MGLLGDADGEATGLGFTTMLGRKLPAIEDMVRDAGADVCAFAAFPQSHWKKIASINPLDAHAAVRRTRRVVLREAVSLAGER